MARRGERRPPFRGAIPTSLPPNMGTRPKAGLRGHRGTGDAGGIWTAEEVGQAAAVHLLRLIASMLASIAPSTSWFDFPTPPNNDKSVQLFILRRTKKWPPK